MNLRVLLRLHVLSTSALWLCATRFENARGPLKPLLPAEDRDAAQIRIRKDWRSHTNSFDLIRIVAATMVFWSHQHALLGVPEPTLTLLPMGIGGLGVWMFFAVSGYLNTLSISRHHSAYVFLVNRALRIYPALIVCVIVTVVFGLLFARDAHAFLSFKLLSYVAKNFTLVFGVKMGVPGAFVANPIPEALNGSLWTLPYEVKMYLALALCLAFTRYNIVTPIIVFGSAALIAILSSVGIIPPFSDADFWLIFSALFLSGSAVAAIELLVGMPVATGAVAIAAIVFIGLQAQAIASELLVAIAILVVGRLSAPRWLRPPLDISYGFYLYAFPVQQVGATLFTNFWLALLFSGAVTAILAIASALFVERYALRLKKGFQIPPWANRASSPQEARPV